MELRLADGIDVSRSYLYSDSVADTPLSVCGGAHVTAFCGRWFGRVAAMPGTGSAGSGCGGQDAAASVEITRRPPPKRTGIPALRMTRTNQMVDSTMPPMVRP